MPLFYHTQMFRHSHFTTRPFTKFQSHNGFQITARGETPFGGDNRCPKRAGLRPARRIRLYGL